MINIRRFTAADLPLGLRLKEQAGWNQCPADWHRVLALEPEGCFVAELDARPVGTAATTVFGSVGWISLVLVDRQARGRGIGTQLVRHALEWLTERSVATIRLDATPLGRPIYEQVGFKPDYELQRWSGRAETDQISTTIPASRDAASVGAELAAILEFDRLATGTDRRRLLEQLWAERQDRSLVSRHQSTGVHGTVEAYGWLRPGSPRAQIGPVVARCESDARSVLSSLCESARTRDVILDIPVDNRPATDWAWEHGFQPQRALVRMTRGPRVAERLEWIWASFGPEKG